MFSGAAAGLRDRFVLHGGDRLRVLGLCLIGSMFPAHAESAWHGARDVDGVPVESRAHDSKYKAHRGEVELCGDLQTVLMFVADVSRIPEWVPWTGSAKALEQTSSGVIYHVVTQAPWPYKPRDMIYGLDVEMNGTSATVTMTGMPERIAPVKGMFRMRAAQGLWRFEPAGDRLRVALELWIDPGGGPAVLVNRRAATTLGRMLGNLRDEFPCKAAQRRNAKNDNGERSK